VRVLVDHNLPHKLRTSLGTLGKHEIVTASYMGWGELKNGELLRTAEENGIEVFLTGDQSLVDEQNLTGRRLAILALSANNWPIVKNHVPRILAAIDSALPGSFQAVDCGRFSRRKIADG
jgi:predicted nuclease of predicted toxin-antitoxin system